MLIWAFIGGMLTRLAPMAWNWIYHTYMNWICVRRANKWRKFMRDNKSKILKYHKTMTL